MTAKSRQAGVLRVCRFRHPPTISMRDKYTNLPHSELCSVFGVLPPGHTLRNISAKQIFLCFSRNIFFKKLCIVS